MYLKTLGSQLWTWINSNILDLGRQMRLSYLPPLMVYMAAGLAGLTGIVGTFFVKDSLGLSAEFLAMLGFWAGMPWALKMPLGHLVDLLWRWKAVLVFLGAALIGLSLVIMLGLLGSMTVMTRYLRAEVWFVLSTLLAPLGYVIQDVVADAMTVEAVPTVDEQGRPYDPQDIKAMHTTMQTLGRVAIVGGGIAVSLANILMFSGVSTMTPAEQVAVYLDIYRMALGVPVISVLGVIAAAVLKQRRVRQLRRAGWSPDAIGHLLDQQDVPPRPNWWILGGSLVFVLFTLLMGLSTVPFNQEIIFAGSLAIVTFLMAKLVKELSPLARRTLVGIAMVIFVFRALPGPGAGSTWWQIDVLGFDQQFLATLSLIGSTLALGGMFVFRRFMAEKSIVYVVGFLTIAGTLLTLPYLGMYYGLHEWTAAHTNGVINARVIAIVDTTLESPLGQVAMIPMLAWIAHSAPAQWKATFFAVMASFTNLALSLSQLGTKYLNQIFTVTRADYSELGFLLIVVTAIGLLTPLLAIVLVQKTLLRNPETCISGRHGSLSTAKASR